MQPVMCYGEYNFMYSKEGDGIAPPYDSLDFRMGGSKKRHAIYDLARVWNKAHLDHPPFRVSAVDAWQLTDNRMETTYDGRHWIAEGKKWAPRKGIGEAEGISRPSLLIRLDSGQDFG
jgi:hypothetical protein